MVPFHQRQQLDTQGERLLDLVLEALGGAWLVQILCCIFERIVCELPYQRHQQLYTQGARLQRGGRDAFYGA